MTWLRTCVLVTVLTVVSGCGFTGINSVPLPLAKGSGDDAVTITVFLDDAANLVANSEVRYDEVVVGSVRRMEFDGWRAKLTVGLEPDAGVPASATAKVAQKSLLGAEYLELSRPAGDTATAMADGGVIDLERTSRYPETEEVLAGAALMLNGGGLPQVKTITTELNAALGGREQEVRSYVDNLGDFTGSLDAQRDSIIEVLEQLDRFSREIVADRTAIDRALVDLPEGVRTLEQQREQLVTSLEALGDLGTTTHRVVTTVEADLQANLEALVSVTDAVVASGTSLGRAFNALATPFTVKGVGKEFIGDYLNLFATISVSVPELTQFFLGGTPLDGLFTGLMGSLPTGPVADVTNPLLAGLPEAKAPDLPGGGLLDQLAPDAPEGSEAPETGSLTGLLGQLLGGA